MKNKKIVITGVAGFIGYHLCNYFLKKNFDVYGIDNLNSYLAKFDIRPMSLNDVSYTKYPYTYDTSLQELHSHTYVVDFNDYFDRTLYDSSSIEVPYINLNTNYFFPNF